VELRPADDPTGSGVQFLDMDIKPTAQSNLKAGFAPSGSNGIAEMAKRLAKHTS